MLCQILSYFFYISFFIQLIHFTVKAIWQRSRTASTVMKLEFVFRQSKSRVHVTNHLKSLIGPPRKGPTLNNNKL